jgi:SSS family solute:Na+ symporter
MTKADISIVILSIGILTVLYTLLGGITAVLWTDVIQGVMLLGGGIVILLFALFGQDAGPLAVITTAVDGNKFSWGSWHFSVIEDNIWIHLSIGLVWALQRFATDQHMVQRYLVARSDKDARRAAWIGGISCLPVWTLFWVIGALVWAYYQLGTDAIPSDVVSNKSNIIPYFVQSQLPAGVIGLITAALIAAAMSSLDSDLNSIATVLVEDYYQRIFPGATDRHQLLAGRCVIFVLGSIAILFAMIWLGVQSAVTFMFELISIAAAGVLGLFILGMFFRRVAIHGALAGIIACVVFTTWATLTSVELPVFGRTVFDMGDYNYSWNNKLIGVFGNIIMVSTALAVSYLVNKPQDESTQLTLWSGRE